MKGMPATESFFLISGFFLKYFSLPINKTPAHSF
jgi:hypothetical protein